MSPSPEIRSPIFIFSEIQFHFILLSSTYKTPFSIILLLLRCILFAIQVRSKGPFTSCFCLCLRSIWKRSILPASLCLCVREIVNINKNKMEKWNCVKEESVFLTLGRHPWINSNHYSTLNPSSRSCAFCNKLYAILRNKLSYNYALNVSVNKATMEHFCQHCSCEQRTLCLFFMAAVCVSVAYSLMHSFYLVLLSLEVTSSLYSWLQVGVPAVGWLNVIGELRDWPYFWKSDHKWDFCHKTSILIFILTWNTLSCC